MVVLAATDWMDWLAGQGALASAPVAVACNRLVIAGPPDAAPLALHRCRRSPPGSDPAAASPWATRSRCPPDATGSRRWRRWASGQALAPRLILAENVRAALAYVARGDVALGLVYASDTLGTPVVRVAAIPASAHAPIVYPGAVLRGAAPDAAAFLAHVAASPDIFAAHGFSAPPA